jgi:bacillolysin
MNRRRAVVASLVVAGVVLTLVEPPHGASRSLTIAATSDAFSQLREWDRRVDQMTRSGELRLRESRDDSLVPGRRHERFDQFHRGIPVWGADVARQTERGLTISLFGILYDGVTIATEPTLSAEDARDTAASLAGGVEIGGPLPRLFVLPLEDGSYALAYKCQAITADSASVYFIDAHDGHVRMQYSLIESQSAVVAGTGVLGDRKKVSVTAQSGTYLADDQLRPPALRTFDLRGNFAAALNALNGVTTLGTSDLAADPSSTWTDGGNVDAHVYEGYTYDFYFKKFGRRGLDAEDARIAGLTHTVKLEDVFSAPPSVLGTFYINAFYCRACGSDGKGMMVYGEGLPANVRLVVGSTLVGVRNFAGSLDVVAHELTHGVTAFSSRLTGPGEPGALNEAFSDMMGASVEFFIQPPGTGPMTADYLMGEDLVTSVVPTLVRSLQDPQSLGTPDHYSRRLTDPFDNGEVHANSTIVSHAFYLAIEGGTNRTSGLSVQGVGAANREQIEKVFYRGFTQLLPSSATFSVARAATVQAARDLYGAGSAVERAVVDAWTAVGVN